MFQSELISGIFAPIVTPFDENENICFDSIRDNILRYNHTDLRGYMPLGSNGEFLGLTDSEALQVLETVCKYKAPEKVVVGGCGRESACKTVEFIRQVAGYGLDLAFILPPHYFLSHMTDEHLYRYYAQVADASPIPIVIYNAPKFAGGLDLSPALIRRLASHENIVACKNSAATSDSLYIEATRDEDFHILAGNIKKLYPSLLEGSIGGVISTATYLPEYCCRIYQLFRDGERTQAAALHHMLAEFSAAGIGPMGVPGVKLGMELRGLIGGHVRCPLMDATEAQRRTVEQLFAEYQIGPAEF